MAASDEEVKQLKLQISASTELLVRNLKSAEAAVGEFRRDTDRQLDQVDKRFFEVGRSIGSNIRGALVSSAVGLLGGTSLVALAKNGLDYASSLGEVSQQLGVTTRDLQVYRYAATQVGISQEDMEKGLAKLTLSIGQAADGSKKQASAFNELGINVRTAGGEIRSTGDILPQLAEALAKIKDPATQSRVAYELMGKSAQKFLPLFTDGAKGISELATAAEKAGLTLSDDLIKRADETADKLGAVQTVLSAKIAGVVAENSDAILIMANALSTLASNAADATVATRNFFAIRAFDGGKNSGAALDLVKTSSGRTALLNELNAKIEQNQKDRAAGRGARTSHLGGLFETTTNAATPAETAERDRQFKALVRQRNAVLAIDRAAEARQGKRTSAPQATGLNRIGGGGSGGGGSGGRKAAGGSKPKAASLADRLKAEHDPEESLYISAELAAAGSDAHALTAELGSLEATLAQIRTGLEGVNIGAMLPDEEQRRLEEFASSFRRDLAGGLAEAIVYGGDLGDVLVNSLKRAGAAWLESKLSNLGSGGGGLDLAGAVGPIKSFLGGAFAGGGDPPVGRVSLVGERGPELFIPKVNGTIVPNHMLGGSGPISIHMPISLHAPGADPAQLARLQGAFDEAQRSMPARIVQVVTDAKQRRVVR